MDSPRSGVEDGRPEPTLRPGPLEDAGPLADAGRQSNAHCPVCGALEWFGQRRAIIRGPHARLTCVELPGVDEDEWLCNRCGRTEPARSPLHAMLDRIAAEAGSLATR